VCWRLATRTDSIIDVARRLADELYLSVDAGKFSRVVLVYAASETGSGWEARSNLLLPFDPSPWRPRQGFGSPPLHYLPPQRLIEKLIEELVFAGLLRAALESFASENAACLGTMQSAHQAIEEKLRDMQRDANVQR
jgi:F-type H+-transporting ATPase subunit gamma